MLDERQKKVFDAKQYSRMNVYYARECTMFAPEQLLRHWHEQQPNNHGDLDSCVTRESITWGGPASD
jgi:hypothetical protein